MSGQTVPDVTILVPAKNEEATIEAVIQRLVALPISKQIIVVDDGSTDGTYDILCKYSADIIAIKNPNPGGKGKAIRAGLSLAEGRVVMIQDADLEYFPEEIPKVTAPILSGQNDVVYGSRFTQGMHPSMELPNKIVNRLLAWLSKILYGQRITDEATCYKAFRTAVLEDMQLVCERFEFCPEVTAKASRLGYKIKEVPIGYEPRSVKAGKKIRWTDGVEAIWTLIRYWRWRPEKKD